MLEQLPLDAGPDPYATCRNAIRLCEREEQCHGGEYWALLRRLGVTPRQVVKFIWLDTGECHGQCDLCGPARPEINTPAFRQYVAGKLGAL